jgi:RHS repeat-associated protein
MNAGLRSLVLCLMCCFAPAFAPTCALAEGSAPLGGTGSSPVESPLVVPEAQSLVGGQGVGEAEEARRDSPEAVAARSASATEYEGLSAEQVAKLAEESFPGLIDDPAGGPPQLPAGQTIVGFPADDAAQVDLGEGRHGVVEATEPMAVETSPGRREPVDLGLGEAGGVFQPVRPDVAVSIPKQLGDGVQLAGTGVSLTPVDSSGLALGGSEGVVDGVSVIYANTQADADTVVKPATLGFSEDTLLRSVESPQQLSFRVGMPEGASLVAASDGSGAVKVMEEGQMIASIRPPSARDAVGTSVPVSMAVSGDTLVLSVDDPPGVYQYPIEVDPEVEDKLIGGEYETNWRSVSNNEFYRYYNLEGGKWEANFQGWAAKQWLSMEYPTQGKSHILSFYAETAGSDPSSLEDDMTIFTPSKVAEGNEPLPSSYSAVGHTVKATGSADEDVAEYVQYANANDEKDAEAHNYMYKATVTISQTEGPSVSFNTTSSTTKSGRLNVLYGNEWIGSHTGEFEVNASDPGIGISGRHVSEPGWSEEINLLGGGDCAGVQCEEQFSGGYSAAEKLPNGEDTVEAKVWNATGLNATASAVAKVDTTLPYDITLSGLGSGDEIGEGGYTLGVEAKEGTEPTKSSGIKSIALTIDGREYALGGGSCSPGPCTARGTRTINGDELGAGEHKLTATVTTNAGNVASETFTLKVHHATPVSLGPGSVDPQSGEFDLGATDVSVSAPGSSLTVTRHYGSRHLTAGSEGPLGPQWSLSVGGQESITKLANGNVTLTASNEGQSTFTSSGGGKFASPTGDADLALSEVKNEKGELTEYLLKDAADSATTRFTSTNGPTGSLWKPTKEEGPLASQTVRYLYQTVEGATRPTYALAPEPAGLSFSCASKLEKSEKLEKGCRALEFKYASTTTATGESKSKWGEYKGRLKEVLFIAYNPSSKAMAEPAVAEYTYDSQGRLRGEWDPQISPTLITTYGYDAEGHVVAFTPPGQESWAFTYSDSSGETGRLLKATQAPASAGLWDGEAPVKTVTPAVSGSAVVGSVLGVSNGTWSNGPVAYAYQWELCNAKGEGCGPLGGATSQNYTVTSGDLGHTLVARVTAINGGGSATAVSATTGKIFSPGTETVEYSVSKESDPEGIAGGSDGNMWFAEYHAGKIGKVTPSGTITEYSLPSGSDPTGIAAGPEKEKALWFTNNGTGKIGKITTSGTITEYSLPTGSHPKGITAGPDGNLWFTNYYNPTEPPYTAKIGKITPSGTITEYPLPNESYPYGITAGPEKEKALWFTDNGTHKIGKITTSGTVTEYSLPKESEPEGITAGPDGNLWFTEWFGLVNAKIGKITTSGTITEYKLPEASFPNGITAGPEKEGALWFTTLTKLGKITTSGTITEYSASSENLPQGITTGPSMAAGEGLWYSDLNTSKITTRFYPKVTNGEKYSPAPGWTVEYNVPLSGTGLPNLTKTEVEKWGQTDDPTEAMAIFPPDEPQSWPASDYTRATIHYLDEEGRAVNTSSPTGGISTTEYNTYNDVVRTLSPDDRAAALKETGKTAEVSKELDTENTYEEKGSEPGTQLLETLGPRHTVKLAQGKEKADEEVLAREHMKYDYNEGDPSEGGPYDLVTKTIEDAQTASKEEFDKRETTTAYSGQENIGWKLRKPTSVTTNPSGLKLTHTILYEPSTGEMSETRMPANTKEKSPHATEAIYYTVAANSKYAACGEHAEWAGLPCQSQPAKQPETSGLPTLPVTTYTAYNIWDEPETTTETAEKGTEKPTRTKTETYDAAGRLKTSAISSTVGTALPTVTDEYNEKTGALEKQCANEGKPCTEGKPKTITSVYNTLGQVTSYTDADENTTTYEYEKEKDARLIKVNDGKGTETDKYNATTGLPEELVSEYGTSKLAFKATYDVEGNMLSKGYPNGMSANYTYNQVSEPINLEYKKTTDCTEEKEKCVWFKDAIVPSIHGQSLEQTSTLSRQAYIYDAAGRLTQVQNTPAGKGCTTRIYAYEEETNRTSLTTREPNAKGECATEGGTVEKHTYDEADRLTDTGTSYNLFGDITALPATDAGGKEASEELTSAYYTDNQLASQTQNGETIGYNLDPAGRTRETVSTGKTSQDIINHYAAGGDSPAWTIETPSGNWTRNIQGIGGGLAAIQVNGATPVLQLTDLHGDIIGTAALSETETKLLTMTETSEYGVPTTSTPAKYSWLGAEQQPTELASGVIAMGARSYVPQLGRFLQPDPQAGGSANAYSYTFGDPINTSDPTGEFTVATPIFAYEFNDEQANAAVEAAEAAARRAAEEAAAREAAERQRAAAAFAAAAAGPQTSLWSAGGAEGPLGGSEGWACEYAAETGQEGEECGGGSISLGYFADLEDPATGCTAYGAPGCKNTKGGGHIANEKCPKSSSNCGISEHGSGGDTCRTIAGSTAIPALYSGPPGWISWLIYTGACEIPS